MKRLHIVILKLQMRILLWQEGWSIPSFIRSLWARREWPLLHFSLLGNGSKPRWGSPSISIGRPPYPLSLPYFQWCHFAIAHQRSKGYCIYPFIDFQNPMTFSSSSDSARCSSTTRRNSRQDSFRGKSMITVIYRNPDIFTGRNDQDDGSSRKSYCVRGHDATAEYVWWPTVSLITTVPRPIPYPISLPYPAK